MAATEFILNTMHDVLGCESGIVCVMKPQIQNFTFCLMTGRILLFATDVPAML